MLLSFLFYLFFNFVLITYYSSISLSLSLLLPNFPLHTLCTSAKLFATSISMIIHIIWRIFFALNTHIHSILNWITFQLFSCTLASLKCNHCSMFILFKPMELAIDEIYVNICLFVFSTYFQRILFSHGIDMFACNYKWRHSQHSFLSQACVRNGIFMFSQIIQCVFVC